MRADPEATEDDIVDPQLFAGVERHDVVDREIARFPLQATSASHLGAMFSIPLEQAWALLPATERLVPVRVTPRRAAISFFAWRVRRSGLGAYGELGVAIPVLLDAPKVPTPLPPALWREPSLGLYAVELPVDSERCAAAGIGLRGLPHVVGEADVALEPLGGRARFTFEGRKMADLSVGLSRWPRERRHDISFQTYSLLDGRIVRTRFNAVAEGYRGRRGTAEISFGDHRRAQRLGRLTLSRRPLELRLLPRVNWLTLGPEDLGPL